MTLWSRTNVFLLLAVSWSGAAGCQGGSTPQPEEADTATYQSIEAAQEAFTERFIDRTGVAGTAIGACGGNPCIKVYVVGIDAPVTADIPDSFGGFPVDVEVTGELRPRGTDG